MAGTGRNQSRRGASTDPRVRIGTILVPTDFSVESLKAARYAVALLRRFDGKLHLIHVHDIDYSYAVPAMLAVSPLVTNGEVEAYCRGELQKVAATCKGMDSPPALHCQVGRAYDQICELAREISADLIVISTHGRTGLKHLLMGSTTERVVRHAPCPVLVVRERERDFVAAGGWPIDAGAPLGLGRICVPVDFSECSAHGVLYAASLAANSGARLFLIHAVQMQPFIPADRFTAYSREPSPELIERAARMEMRKFTRAIDFGGVPYESSIEIGRPGDQVCRFADAKGCELIVTSTHGTTGFAHVVLGSTAEHIVRYARCPVLVVPHRTLGRSRKLLRA